MVQEERPQEVVVREAHHLASVAAFHALGAPAARAVEGEPLAALREPFVDDAALLVVRIRPGHVGDQEVDAVQALADIGEVVGDRGGVAALVELAEEFDAREVHVVPRVGADGESPDDQVCSLGHGSVPS